VKKKLLKEEKIAFPMKGRATIAKSGVVVGVLNDQE